MTSSTVRVAAVQAYSRFGDAVANRTKLSRLVREAAGHGAKVVVLPEASISGYMTPDFCTTWHAPSFPAANYGLRGVSPVDVAETVPGRSTTEMGALAAELGVYLTVPLVEVDLSTGRFFNTSVLLGPDGQQLIHYRKLNPWPYPEDSWTTPGDLGNPTVDTPFGRLGLLICFDIHQQATVMGQKNVDILLYSIAWVDQPNSSWFSVSLPHISKREGFHMIASNWTIPSSPTPAWCGYGMSRIISADGEVLAHATGDFTEEAVIADLPVREHDRS